MKLPRFFGVELSITGRLLCWFLAISLIPCLLLTGLIEYISSDSLEKSMRSGLMVIAEAKASAIDNFVRERRGDVTLAGHLQSVMGATTRLSELLKTEKMDSPAYKKESEPYRKVISYYKDAYGYSNAYIFALDGTLLFRLDDDLDIGTNLKEGAMKDTELADVFERSKMLLQSMFADFQLYPGRKEPLAFVANPVFDPRGVNIGIVVLQLGNKEIYRVLNDLNGLGETGETVVGQLKGDEVTVVAPLRFDPEAAFRRKVRLGGAEMAGLQRAVQGQSGFGETVDYRGKQVVAVWSYLPSFRWGLVVKQDASEAFALIHQQRLAIGGLLAATLVLVVVVALIVARSISRPIREPRWTWPSGSPAAT